MARPKRQAAELAQSRLNDLDWSGAPQEREKKRVRDENENAFRSYSRVSTSTSLVASKGRSRAPLADIVNSMNAPLQAISTAFGNVEPSNLVSAWSAPLTTMPLLKPVLDAVDISCHTFTSFQYHRLQRGHDGHCDWTQELTQFRQDH